VHDLADRIDALLPQTQCTKCGFDGCRPYAEAIAGGAAGIDRCPPGGEAGIAALAALLDRPIVPLDTERGLPGPLRVARIDEQHCIGCTLCIQACPVDAIVGANKRMHIILPSACTGCDLCVAPCPVDCIHMEPVAPARAWTDQDAADARRRYTLREARLTRDDDRSHLGAGSPARRGISDGTADGIPRAMPSAMPLAASTGALTAAPALERSTAEPATDSAVAGLESEPAAGTQATPTTAPVPLAVPLADSAAAPSPDSTEARKQAILAAALARARARRAG
jgi:electron transport complex protein RnfB